MEKILITDILARYSIYSLAQYKGLLRMRKTASVLCKSLVGLTTPFQLSEERQKQNKNLCKWYRRDTRRLSPQFF